MKFYRKLSSNAVIASIGLGVVSTGVAQSEKIAKEGGGSNAEPKTVVSSVVRGGQIYTSEKVYSQKSDVEYRHFDSKGRAVKAVPAFSRPMIDPRLMAMIKAQPKNRLDVVFALNDKPLPFDGPVAVVDVMIDGKGAQNVLINGEKSSIRRLAKLQNKWLSYADELSKARSERRQNALRKLVEATGWQDLLSKSDEGYQSSSVRRNVVLGDLLKLADRLKGVVIAIEPWVKEYDEIDDAMAATNIQGWAIDRDHDGTNSGVYMREANGSRCPSSSNMNSGRYTNISSLSSSGHANRVGNIIATVSPDAHVYCGSSDFLSSPGSRSPRPWVANHSWGADDSGSYTTRDRDFDTGIYDDGWTVFKSAGNTGGEITSPGKAMNIIAVGNYNDATTTMSSTSAFIDPDSNVDKPEIAAPGSVSTDAGNCSGTSCAAPHAAGFAANLLGRYSWLRGQPSRVKALMMAGATDNIEGSARLSDLDGAGGIDYLNSGYNGRNTVWWGGNGSHFNSQKEVTTTRTFTAGRRYRVALSWLVPGSFAFSPSSYHSHSYTINMDLDLSIIGPNGNTIARSSSWDNPFEIVDFTAPDTGTYTIRIYRFANSGQGKINMAIHSQRVL